MVVKQNHVRTMEHVKMVLTPSRVSVQMDLLMVKKAPVMLVRILLKHNLIC